jgi:hypothetical protein
VPLADLATIEVRDGATIIARRENERAIAVRTNIRGRDQGRFVADAQARFDQDVKLPPGYTVVWGGQFENLSRARERLDIIMPITLGIIFVCCSPRWVRSTPSWSDDGAVLLAGGIVATCAAFASTMAAVGSSARGRGDERVVHLRRSIGGAGAGRVARRRSRARRWQLPRHGHREAALGMVANRPGRFRHPAAAHGRGRGTHATSLRSRCRRCTARATSGRADVSSKAWETRPGPIPPEASRRDKPVS